MAHTKSIQVRREETPIDDVRRVRERLDREAAGDIRTLAEQSRAAVEQYRQQLDLKPVAMPPAPTTRRDATAG